LDGKRRKSRLFIEGGWTQIKDKFILAAGDTYKKGQTGGESSHTLTASEMPRYTHRIYFDNNYSANSNGVSASTNQWKQALVNQNNTTTNIDLSFTGNSQAHNNMSPYEVFYCWKRVQ
jgi:microcystin-dependent protein